MDGTGFDQDAGLDRLLERLPDLAGLFDGQRHRMQVVAVQGAVLKRGGVVADLLHRPLGELVRVDDDLRAQRMLRRARKASESIPAIRLDCPAIRPWYDAPSRRDGHDEIAMSVAGGDRFRDVVNGALSKVDLMTT